MSVATLAIGPSPQISSETESLLRYRLRAGALVILVGVALFMLRDMALGSAGPFASRRWLLAFLPRFGVVVFYGASIALLRSDGPLSLTRLRRLEVLLLWVVALWFATDRYTNTRLAIATGSAVETVWAVAFSVMTYFAFLSAYGFLIPNDWRRALKMTIPLAATPLVVVLLVIWHAPERWEFLRGAGTSIQLTSLSLMLAIGVMIATLGAHRIHALRVEAFEAKRLGQYVLTERIGSGGMGEVWKATHRLLARPAAIKLIKPEIAGARDLALAHDFAASFEREAQATASLRSIHTVELYDFGVTPDSTFYYVMELLDGLDLQSMVERYGSLPAARVAYLLEQVCDSLAEAHGQGLVHGDVKPANLAVCRMGRRFDFVKVLDFGLVRTVGRPALPASPTPRGARVPALLHRGRIVGTPSYMAPEAAAGGAVDGRADIYSLGCVGYWLLTGVPVFEGETPSEVIAKHAGERVVPPSRRTGGEVPAPLEELVLSCLRKDPAARPQSAEGIADRLVAAGLASTWTQANARAWWREQVDGIGPVSPTEPTAVA